MKSLRVIAAVAILLAPLAVQAQPKGCAVNSIGRPEGAAAAIGPTVWALVNERCFDLSSSVIDIEKGKIWSLKVEKFNDGFGNIFSLGATMNADPFISFGATTSNGAAGPVTYAFLFFSPVVPGMYGSATSTGGVSVTNGASGTSIVATSGVYPKYISGEGMLGVVPTNLGVDIGTAPCMASGVPSTVTTTCPQGSTGSLFAPTSYDGMRALLTYTQTDIGSIASWSGAVTLNSKVVPEPATFALFGAGMLLVGVAARRRRS